MAALLVVGALALLATLFFAAGESWTTGTDDGRGVKKFLNLLRGLGRALRTTGKSFWWGFGVAVLVWAAGVLALLTSITSLMDNAHYIAALGLFLCILGVAVVNARRYRDEQQVNGASAEQVTDGPDGAAPVPNDSHTEDHRLKSISPRSARLDAVTANAARYRYTAVAWAMLLITPVLAMLWLTDRISLFWLEIFVAAIFIVFWMMQTIELLPPRAAATDRTSDDRRVNVASQMTR